MVQLEMQALGVSVCFYLSRLWYGQTTKLYGAYRRLRLHAGWYPL